MKTVTLLIPVYNEEHRIHKTVDALCQGFAFPGIKLQQIIFVDDGSTDGTKFKIQNSKFKIEKELKVKVKVLSYEQNKGKGYAVRRGMQAANADYTLVFDADLSTPLSEFAKLLPHVHGGVDVIVGTRKNGVSTVVVPQPLHRDVLGKGFTLLSNIMLNTWVTDFTCGFKAFSKQANQAIFSCSRINRWSYDAEVIFLAQLLSLSIQEVPVLWAHNDRSQVRILRDIFVSFKELIEIRKNHLRGVYTPSSVIGQIVPA